MDGPYWTPATEAAEMAQRAQQSAWDAAAWANTPTPRKQTRATPPETVEVIESPQHKESVKLEPGKRYRWIVEGVADEHGNLGFGNDKRIFKNDELPYGKAELLSDPLPTTAGSVAWTKEGDPNSGHPGPFPWMLGIDGDWTDGLNYRRSGDQMSELTVVRVFDSGASDE